MTYNGCPTDTILFFRNAMTKHMAKTDTMVENSAMVAAVVVIATDLDDSMNRSPLTVDNSIVIKTREQKGDTVVVVVLRLRLPRLYEATAE